MTDREFKFKTLGWTGNEAERLQAIRRELADFTIHNGGPMGLCEVSVTDVDGSARPCGRDVFGYSWYEGGEHEPLLSMTCMEHANEAGGLIAGLYWTAYDLLERATRLTVERDRARDLAARLEEQVAEVESLTRSERMPWGIVLMDGSTVAEHLRAVLDAPEDAEFVDRFFVKAQGMSPDAKVTRIEWRYLDGVSE